MLSVCFSSGICTRSKTTDTCNVPSSLVNFIWCVTVLVKELFYLGDYSVYLFSAQVAEWKFQDYNSSPVVFTCSLFAHHLKLPQLWPKPTIYLIPGRFQSMSVQSPGEHPHKTSPVLLVQFVLYITCQTIQKVWGGIPCQEDIISLFCLCCLVRINENEEN